MILYTIYTEDMRRKQIEKELVSVLRGFTIRKCEGYWEGKKEKSLVIEILVDDPPDASPAANSLIASVCEKIKKLNAQDSVLYTVQKVEGKFI